ncbi:expressed unknown protein [Seminavis robusta]|uniref:tRNA (guanine(46)-N(7))-methyltransferase n=1 Tax=Seminavis robusta TaxID=568900 RepID=A0A9N8HQX7_9STRA|nr:expressed unknown protein [Seminavis robusta]|eukprot:Sro1336_g264020.1 n/a (702) ;mRNA; r:12356-14461
MRVAALALAACSSGRISWALLTTQPHHLTGIRPQCSGFWTHPNLHFNRRPLHQRHHRNRIWLSTSAFSTTPRTSDLDVSPFTAAKSSHYCHDQYASWEEELFCVLQTISSRDVNPCKEARLDIILQRLNSPAPQSYHVLQRAIHRAQEQSTNDDGQKSLGMIQTVAHFVVKKGYQLVVYEYRNDNSKDNQTLEWEIVPIDRDLDCSSTRQSILPPQSPHFPPQSTLQIANEILDLVTDASERQVPVPQDSIHAHIQSLQEQLSWTMGMDLRGRTSADAAFTLALSGAVHHNKIFQSLAAISQYELLRVGHRPTFQARYILQIVEKHAAAGTRGLEPLYQVAADCLKGKEEQVGSENDAILQSLESPPLLDLLSPRPLLWLWRFSARQRKVKNQPQDSDDNDNDNSRLPDSDIPPRPAVSLPAFQDPSRPLVVDLGCGFGTSLLGLASTFDEDNEEELLLLRDVHSGSTSSAINTRYNFWGADLSQLAIQFATGIVSRWGLQETLAYSWGTAEECLDAIIAENKQAQIALIMIQFPTPYRLQRQSSTNNGTVSFKGDGNSQLPEDFSSGFMVNDDLLGKVASIMSQSCARLLIQSNCEDVAVTIRNRAVTQHGMKVAAITHSVACLDHFGPNEDDAEQQQQQTLRNLEWISMGGERAEGHGWSAKPLLPPRARTETEVACQLQGTPIHRCLLDMEMTTQLPQ